MKKKPLLYGLILLGLIVLIAVVGINVFAPKRRLGQRTVPDCLLLVATLLFLHLSILMRNR